MENKFEVINSQEKLDAILKDRLARAEEKHQKEIEELKKTLGNVSNEEFEKIKQDNLVLNSKLEEQTKLNAKNSLELSKTKIAYEKGLGNMIEFIQGTTEEEILASAKKLQEFTKAQTHVVVAASKEPKEESADAELRSMLKTL